MKLTKDLLRQLIVEALEEGDVIQGKFGGTPAVDRGEKASVAKLHPEPELPEGVEWLEDASSLIHEIMNNINDIARADESLAHRLFDLADKLSPIFKTGKETMGQIPDDAFLDDPEHVSQASTERSYDPSEQEPEDT